MLRSSLIAQGRRRARASVTGYHEARDDPDRATSLPPSRLTRINTRPCSERDHTVPLSEGAQLASP
jgi:hypothetical protein